jgi:hypothetical protein
MSNLLRCNFAHICDTFEGALGLGRLPQEHLTALAVECTKLATQLLVTPAPMPGRLASSHVANASDLQMVQAAMPGACCPGLAPALSLSFA